ncbi:unnamed protein product [Closterium sp. NIES-64]|nr:unnamed protein product [Closterium sp. NIES-64]
MESAPPLSAMPSPASLLVALLALLLTALLAAAFEFFWGAPRRAMADLAAQGVPGPPFRFFYGILADMIQFRKRRQADPEFAARSTATHVLDTLVASYGPVVRYCFGPMSRVLLADPTLVRAAYITHNDAFPKTTLIRAAFPLFGNGLVTASGPFWATQRRRINPAFKHSELKRMFPTMLECTQAALSLWEKQVLAEPDKEVRIDTMLETLTLDVIGRAAFGARLGGPDGENEERGEGKKGGAGAEGGGKEGKEGKSDAEVLVGAFRAYLEAAVASVRSPLAMVPGFLLLPTALHRHRNRQEQLIRSIMMRMIAARRHRRHHHTAAVAAAAPAAGSENGDGTGGAKGSGGGGGGAGEEGAIDLLELMLMATDEESGAAAAGGAAGGGGTAAATNGVAAGDAGAGGAGGALKAAAATAPAMSDQQLMDECLTFLLAGHETTSNLLTWTVMLLSQHNTWQQRVREEAQQVLGADGAGLTMEKAAELKIMGMVLNEVLRLYPPAPAIARRCDTRTKLSETLTIPAGVGVTVPIAAMHRRKELWGEDAEEFKPERFANGINKAAMHPLAFIPFSVGPRVCIGQNFAVLEAKVILSLLVLRFSWRVAPSYRHCPEQVLTLKTNPITSSTANEKPDLSSKKDDGLMTEIPADIAKQAASGNAAGVTYVDTAQDTFFMADVKKAGWNAQKCPPGLNKELAGACTPKNCSKGGIAAKWKTAYLQKNKLGYELYVPGNPLTLLKANPASCCNTCAATPACTYWQYIPDITIDGKKGKGACYLIHDQIDFTCGEMTAQYNTETKPVPLQVRIGGECNPSAKILNDPHLVGAHGTHFDFNGRPDKAFCLLTDRDLHVNMLLRGYYDARTDNAALVVDGKAVHTWIKELGIVWTAAGADHKIRLAARSGKQQERGEGFMKSIEIDGEEIPRMKVGDTVTSAGGLTVQFRAEEKEGPFDVDYYLLTIDGLVSLDLRLRVAHPKLQTPTEAEAHINVGIAELEHTDEIHGVLGQTYRADHSQRAVDFQRLIASLHRPISADSAEGKGFLDGTPRSYEASDVLAVDCAYTAYGRAREAMPVQQLP